MVDARSAPPPRTRRTQAERRRETREALVIAALNAFARDGYHTASLEGIAGEAGFSKGAVYSNFNGKSDLFLAAMDYNLETLNGGGWNPLRKVGAATTDASEPGAADMDVAGLVRGFGLATLEFIATAARDDELVKALRERMRRMIDAYGRIATEARPDTERLPSDDVARLMAALDQGVSVLALSGITEMDGALTRVGLHRLVNPLEAAAEPAPERDGQGEPLADIPRVQRLIGDILGT
ncbi:TetR/AcrR family transcriptional regulator [Actinoalloteichus caeruleus]|uniref:Transcriptional regulator, TetR family n=2 Tax=Actinoalloteichus cyanogriseus TaxID=2893586 RepID=A0ABT1JHL7_ACTCY|nr:TetR/AcrR family transcriptional regulator [Actinoalloteichus caeruleus]MCP2331271.1 transcriptional regulator, TetR family [Actinoalloteichus caeruleus DSM 43889]